MVLPENTEAVLTQRSLREWQESPQAAAIREEQRAAAAAEAGTVAVATAEVEA